MSEYENILEAKHVYVLMKRDYGISRNTRAEWYFKHINNIVKLKKRKSLTECLEDLEIVSIVPQTEANGWEPELSHLYEYKITISTNITFLSWKYHLIFCLDIGPSIAVVDIQNGEIMFDELLTALENCLDGVSKPFLIPGSIYRFHPELCVTVITHVPLLKYLKNHVLAQGWHITSENLNTFLDHIKSQLIEIEDNIAEQSIPKHILENYDEELDCSRSDQSQSDIFFHAVSPNMNFVTLVQYGILASQLMAEKAISHIIMVTNGTIGMPDTMTTESLLNQLCSNAISCSFLQIGSSYHPHCCLGYLPYHDLMQYIANATQGTHFSKIPKCNEIKLYNNCFHQALFAWNFQQSAIINKLQGSLVPQISQNDWSTKNPYFYSAKEISPLSKRHLQGNIHTSLSALLSCRMREGYIVKDVSFKENNHLQINFSLVWKLNVNLEYIISGRWPLPTTNQNWHVEVIIESSYDFLRDFVYPIKKYQVSRNRAVIVKYFKLLLQGLQRTDQLLVHLHSFSTNTCHFTIPESIKKRMPLFTGSQNSTSPIPYASDCTNPSFLSFWKPVCSLDTSIWQKWLHIHKISLVLDHDHPLPNYLHTPSENGRYQNVQCRQAMVALHALLTEWSSFVLVENQSYIKFLYSESGKPPISFYIIRVSSKMPCVIIRLAFLGGINGTTRNEVLRTLKDEILGLQFQQRLVVKDTLVRKGLISYPSERSNSNVSYQNQLPQLGSSQFSCCVVFDKPLDKLLFRYEKVPSNYFILTPPKSAFNNGNVSNTIELSNGPSSFPTGLQKPNQSINVANTLFHYLYHHRWIWAMQRLNVPLVSREVLGRILSALVKIRLNEGFSIAHSHNGMVNLVLEVEMNAPTKLIEAIPFRDLTSIEHSHKCVIQYILFPPHTPQSFRESCFSDDDIDVEMDAPEEGELQLITESWVEPHDGVVTNSGHKELEGLNYKGLAKSFFSRDRECISTIVTFEHLSLLTRSEDPMMLPPFLPSRNSYTRSMASSIQHVPFSFDLIQFLPKCHQTELIFSTYIQSPTSNTSDLPNQLLMEILYENLLLMNDCEIALTSQDNRLFPFQVRDRQNPIHLWSSGKSTDEVSSPNSAARTRKISISETSGLIPPNWRCFLKSLTSTHLILTFLPASFVDLKHLVLSGSDQYSKIGLSKIINCETDNKYENQSGFIVLPIFVYDCSLTLLIDRLVDCNEPSQFHDQFIDLTYKTKLELGEDAATLHSETYSSEESKQMFTEPQLDESYISSCSLRLREQCDNIESVFSKCFVQGIFRSLHLGHEIHALDIQTVIDGICTESLMEIDITNFIQTVCGHVRGFKVKTAIEHLRWSVPTVLTDADKNEEMDNDTTSCFKGGGEQTIINPKFPVIYLQNGSCDVNELIKKKFAAILKKSFIPIPSKLDYFFYCLPSFQSVKGKYQLSEIESMDVNEIDIETFKPDLSEIRSDKGVSSLSFMRNFINDDQEIGSHLEVNSQVSVASNIDSESLISIGDMNYCIDERDDIVPPLFIHLTCTLKTKSTVQSCSVRCLPTCLGEILQCLESSVSELDLSDLRITLDIICLTLQSEMNSTISRQRTMSYFKDELALHEPVVSDGTGTIQSSDDSYVNENHEVRSNLPDFQLQAVTKSMEEIKWMLRDEIASAMLEFYPLTEKTLDMVTSHIQSSPGRPDCVVEEVQLQFVFGSEQSMDLFISQFRQMALTGYYIKQEGEFYYLATNQILPLKRLSDASQKFYQQTLFASKFSAFQVAYLNDEETLGKYTAQDSSDDCPHRRHSKESERKKNFIFSKPTDDIRQFINNVNNEKRSVSNSEMDSNAESVVMSDADSRSLSMLNIKDDGFESQEKDKGRDEVANQKYSFMPSHQYASNFLSHTPGMSTDDICSLIGSGQCSTTEDGYDGDNSDVDIEGNDCLSEMDVYTLQLPKFWLILKVLSDKVCVFFHARDTQENKDELQHWKHLYNQVIKNIKNICKLVNQTLLLQDLNDTRMCNQLLESERNEDIWKYDDYLFLKTKQNSSCDDDMKHDGNVEYHDGYLKAILDFMPGAFACNVVWQKHFILHSRLRTGPGRSSVSRGIQAMRGILNSFSVNNRENMFVYAETSGSVFYLRLNESQCYSTSSVQALLDSSSNAENLSAFSAKKSITEEDEINETRSRINSLTDLPLDTASLVSKVSVGKSKTEDSIQLLVHGITEAGSEIKEDLVHVLQNRLDEAVLDVIAVTLSRNPMCKLTSEDVQFIQKSNEPPTATLQFTICSQAQQYLQALNCYLKQNLLQFLHTPKYIDSKPESHFRDYNSGSLALREGDAFLYNRPQGSGNKGIALIALSLVDGYQGNPVQHFSNPHSIPEDHLEAFSANDFESLTFTQLYDSSKQPTKLPGPWNLIQLRIWERGNIDLEQLTNRLLSAIRYALWDVVMEYRILVSSLYDEPLSANPAFYSEPVTPIKAKKSYLPQALIKKERAPSPLALGQVKFRDFSSSVPDIVSRICSPVPSPREPESSLKLTGASITSTINEGEKDVFDSDKNNTDRKLNPIFAKTIVNWMEFAIGLDVPTVWKQSHSLVSRFSIHFVLEELHSLLSNNPNTNNITLKRFRKVNFQEEDIYLPDEIGKKVDPIFKSNIQNDPGKTNDFFLIGRDIKHWSASIKYLCAGSWIEASSFLNAFMLRNDQKFPSIIVKNDEFEFGESSSCPSTAIVTPGAVSFSSASSTSGEKMLPEGNGNVFIPRQKLILVATYDKTIDIYGYNWSIDILNKLKRQTSRLVHWHNARSRLLANIVLQKMGLFHDTSIKKMKTEKDILKATEIDLFKLTCPPTRDNQVPLSTRHQTSSQSNINVKNIFRDTQPFHPMHRNSYCHIQDQVLKNGHQVLDIWNASKKEHKKKLKNLFQNSPTHSSASLKEETLNLLKRSSRIEHYCLTPVLFLPQWRLKVACARDYTIPSFTPKLIVESKPAKLSACLDRRSSITLPVGISACSSPIVLSCRPSNDEYWHTQLSLSYIHEFTQYLQNLGFLPLQLRSNENKSGGNEEFQLVSNLKTNVHHLQKSLIGGSIIILELSIIEPYFSARMYCLETEPYCLERTNNFQFTTTFVDECDKFKTLIHLHSFTYDFHLRSIHSYISGRQLIFSQGYHLTSFLDDFVRYYQKSPNFAWNLVTQDIFISNNTTTPASLLYDHLLNHNKLYGMHVLRMVPFIQNYNQDVDNEYVLVQISNKTVSYKDGNEMRRTDDFDISLLISHEKTSRGTTLDQYTLVLKYFIILTSRRELYPRAVVDMKLGKFRTVATASPILSCQMNTLDPEKFDFTKESENDNLNSSLSDLEKEKEVFADSDAIECVEENLPVFDSERFQVERLLDSENYNRTQSPTFAQRYGGNQTSIRQESVNYLGYFSTNEELMSQIMQEQIESAKSNIARVLDLAIIHCRRDNLWKRLLIGVRENDDKKKEESMELMALGMNFNEFTELLTHVVIQRLNEIDPYLNQLFNMHILWYQGLVKVLTNKYPEMHRLFIDSDSTSQHLVILNPNYKGDMCILLSVESQTNKASLNVIYRISLPDMEQKPSYHSLAVQALIEDVVNACCYHLWTGIV